AVVPALSCLCSCFIFSFCPLICSKYEFACFAKRSALDFSFCFPLSIPSLIANFFSFSAFRSFSLSSLSIFTLSSQTPMIVKYLFSVRIELHRGQLYFFFVIGQICRRGNGTQRFAYGLWRFRSTFLSTETKAGNG